MRRVRIVLLALPVMLAAFVLTSSAALAASPHFKKGGEPTCTFSGTTSIPVTCTGTLAGLGNQDLNIHLAVSGFSLPVPERRRQHRARPEQGPGRPGYRRYRDSGQRDNEREPGVHHQSRHLDRRRDSRRGYSGLSEW